MTTLTANDVRPAFWGVDAQIKSFGHWLLIWVVLANAGFAALWFSGAPPRHIDIVFTGIAGLIATRAPFWFRYPVFAGAVIYSALRFVGGLFNLDIFSLVYSLKFFAEIKPANSMDYIGAGIAMLAILVMGWHLLKREIRFSRPLLIAGAGGLFFTLAGVDLWMGKDMRGHYFRHAPAGATFGSATSASGFAARADGKRHLVLIIVEAMGVPNNNPEMSNLLFAPLMHNTSVASKFEFSRGTVPYYNSTTAGEIRELCGRWGDYYDLVDRKDDSCLPATLAAKGYDTLAMHSFTPSFFGREKWYPNVGFQKMAFKKEMVQMGAEKCGGVFPGACDRDIPRQIKSRLLATDKPTFLYWLTLNSHLPVPSGLNLNVDNCERVSLVLKNEYPQICRQFAIYDDIFTALATEISASDFPEADILIVGDHMPPYFDRHHRTQFNPERVPWLYLKHKTKAADGAV